MSAEKRQPKPLFDRTGKPFPLSLSSRRERDEGDRYWASVNATEEREAEHKVFQRSKYKHLDKHRKTRQSFLGRTTPDGRISKRKKRY